MLRTNFGRHYSVPPLVYHAQTKTVAKDIRSMAIEEAANPLRKPYRSSDPDPAASVAIVVACSAVIGLAWIF